jgi:hypothetical protein
MKLSNQARLLLAASFLGTGAESMLVPLYAPLAHQAGGSVIDAGIGLALFSITTGLFVTTVGLTEWFRKNIRTLLVVGFAVAGIADLCYLFVATRLELFLVQGLVGLALGILNPSWDTIYSVTGGDPTRKWSIWTGGVNLITGIAALLGTLLISHYTFKVIFVFMFVLDMAAVYCSAISVRTLENLDEITEDDQPVRRTPKAAAGPQAGLPEFDRV